MADKIFIGNFAKGLKTDREPEYIDNDSFPTLDNMYTWRGRALRKRGTQLLAQLTRQVLSVVAPANPWEWSSLPLVAGAANLITGPWTYGVYATPTAIEAGSAIVVGSLAVIDTADGQVYTDPAHDGILVGSLGGSGTINYVTGAIFISGGVGPLTGRFDYAPQLPVMGLEDYVDNASLSPFPLLMAFDTKYSYQINQASIPFFYSTSFYKFTGNPVVWSNGDYAQFWTTNYQNAFWATNNKPGLHVVNGAYVAGSGTTTITFNFTSGGPFTTLVVGDMIWFNEWNTPGVTINGQVGEVTNTAGAAAGTYVVTFAVAQTVAGTGFSFLLTNSVSGQDGIKWYDGDPTSGTGIPTSVATGWVNFAPPLTATTVSIDDQPSALYYLVGALMIVPFKDRLLFLGPQIRTATGSVIQQPIEDMVIWSWNGTPYYCALVPGQTGPFTTGPETFDPRAYYVDQTGFAGYLPAGVDNPIMTVMDNEDVLLIGFGGTGLKTRFVYTGNDLQPFLFYFINSEYPSNSTFSAISFDRSGADVGQFGITITSQQSCERADVEIPDEIFEIQALNNGFLRVNAERDFFREWIYFTYPTGSGIESEGSWVYPNTTLMWNYRDNTWAKFRENYTTQGVFRSLQYFTWDTAPYNSWDEWTDTWDSGVKNGQYPNVIGGNPQGYVLLKDVGTGEGISGSITNITASGDNALITSVNHCVNIDDYIQFTGEDFVSTTIGQVIDTPSANSFVVDIPFPSTATITGATQATNAVLTLSWPIPAIAPAVNSYFVGQRISIAGVTGMIELNGNTYTVLAVTPTTVTLNVDSTGFTPYVSGGTTTLVGYIGAGHFARLSRPLMFSKQFPVYWEDGFSVRLGPQRYLMDTTENGQVTVVIALSQDPDNVWNADPIYPDIDSTNNALIYSQLLYTCPESTNLGLTPITSNLQMPIALDQDRIWHRMNTSLSGNTFQVGITLSDLQMRNLNLATDEIVCSGIQIAVSRGPELC